MQFCRVLVRREFHFKGPNKNIHLFLQQKIITDEIFLLGPQNGIFSKVASLFAFEEVANMQ